MAENEVTSQNEDSIDVISTHEFRRFESPTKEKRRICIAIESLEVGGAETHAVNLAEFLRGQNWNVCFAVMEEAKGPLVQRCNEAEIGIYDNLMPGRHTMSTLRNFGKIIAERKVDTLFVVECFYINALLAYRAAKKRQGYNAFAIIHNWPSRREFTHPALFTLRLTLMNGVFHRVVFIADRQQKHYERTLKIRFKRTAVIPSGIDVNRFSPTTYSINRTTTTDLDRNPRVAIIASLQPRKGHDYFLKAASRLLSRRPGVEFLIIGDGPERAALEKLARDLEISSHVAFLGVRNDMPELLHTIDVVVLASHDLGGQHAETLPLALLEAGAAAVPCVATDVGAISDIVVDDRTGYLVPQRDPSALADRIERLLDNPLRCNEMGMIARERIIAKYNADRMNQRFEKLFLTGK